MRRAQLRHRLPFRSEPYTLTLHLPPQQRQAEAQPLSPRQHAAPASRSASEPAEAGAATGAAPPAAAAAAAGAAPDLQDAPHRLQTWFGLGAFLLLTPDSYSGRVLEAEVGAAGVVPISNFS